MRGRDRQKTSPVSQGCTLKRLLNCWSSSLEDKTFCEGRYQLKGKEIMGVHKTVIKVD